MTSAHHEPHTVQRSWTRANRLVLSIDSSPVEAVLVVGMTPVVEIVPVLVVEIVPVLVVEIVPVLVVEMIPDLANVVAETARTTAMVHEMDVNFFISLLLVT